MTLLIDGQDTRTSFGAYVIDGGLRGFVGWPAMKKLISNSWHEMDGQEVDLSNPALDKHLFSIQFGSPKCYSAVRSLANRMATARYHEIEIAGSERSIWARFISVGNVNILGDLGTFSLNLSIDKPMQFPYQTPYSTLAVNNNYKIDNPDSTGMIPLSTYGVVVLQGTAPSFAFVPEAKSGVELESVYTYGTLFDEGALKYKSQDVVLRCLMHNPDTEQFWINYDALLYDLVRPGVRHLYVKRTNKTYRCHYVSQEVVEYVPDDNWIKFNIKLRLLDNLR